MLVQSILNISLTPADEGLQMPKTLYGAKNCTYRVPNDPEYAGRG